MKFDQIEPCPDCPFRGDAAQEPEWDEIEFIADCLTNNKPMTCHKYRKSDPTTGIYYDHPEDRACVGAMLHHRRFSDDPPVYMQEAIEKGELCPDTLRNLADLRELDITHRGALYFARDFVKDFVEGKPMTQTAAKRAFESIKMLEKERLYGVQSRQVLRTENINMREQLAMAIQQALQFKLAYHQGEAEKVRNALAEIDSGKEERGS